MIAVRVAAENDLDIGELESELSTELLMTGTVRS